MKFIVIPPLPVPSVVTDHTLDHLWVYYKCGEQDNWNFVSSLHSGPTSYCLAPLLMTFPDGGQVIHQRDM